MNSPLASHLFWSAGSFKEYSDEKAAGTILRSFLKAEEEKLKEINKRSGQSLYDFITSGLEEEKYFNTLDGVFDLFAMDELKWVIQLPLYLLKQPECFLFAHASSNVVDIQSLLLSINGIPSSRKSNAQMYSTFSPTRSW